MLFRWLGYLAGKEACAVGRCICLLPFSFDLANHIREMTASLREMRLSMQDGESLTFFPNAVPTVARKDPRTE